METEQFNAIAPQETIDRTIAALKANNIEAICVATGAEAKQKVLELVPEGAEVFTMTSVTLATIGVADAINESGKYDSVRKKLNGMDRAKDGRAMRKLGAAPDYVLGSVHAVTESGEVIIASNTGSQLPAYAYGGGKVIWVVGTQKIVRDRAQGLERIYGYALPLESERAKKAYGASGSEVKKLLVIHKEGQPGRITLIFVNEAIGF
jgi:hypothetical protein